MLNLLFRKWWVILIQGIILVLLAFYIFNNPVAALAGASLWFGISVFVTGGLSVIAWLAADKTERESISLLWGLLTTVFGLLMLTNLLATMMAMSMIFGLWMLLTGLHIAQLGWNMRKQHPFGWFICIAGVVGALVAFPMIFNISTGAIGFSTLLGILVLLTGIGLVLFAFIKKNVVGAVRDKIEDVKSRM